MLEADNNQTIVEIFFAYAHNDESLRDQLATHLSSLKHSERIKNWHDRRIEPGIEWNQAIDEHLNRCQIILLLISADFIASDYCYGVEMRCALERHEKGDARVIPVILRPCDWVDLPFGTLQALPKDGKPVTTWLNRDEAFTNIVRGIREAVTSLQGLPPQRSSGPPTALKRSAALSQPPREALVMTDSPRAVVCNVEGNMAAYIPVYECQWAQHEISIELEPDDPTDGPFLDNLRGLTTSLIVAFRNNAAICRRREGVHLAKAGIHRWRLSLQVEHSSFQPVMEMAFQGISSDQMAESRARRLLFNESPPTQTTTSMQSRTSFS